MSALGRRAVRAAEAGGPPSPLLAEVFHAQAQDRGARRGRRCRRRAGVRCRCAAALPDDRAGRERPRHDCVPAASDRLAVADRDGGSNYPANAPKTSLSGFRPNAEAIATYKPDLVVVAYDGGIVSSLTKLGITVLLQPPAGNLAKAYEEIQQLGAATGNRTPAAAVVKSIQVQLTKVIRSVPKAKRKLSVFHEISPDGYSATSSTFIGSIYKLFGFRNVADPADTTHSGFPQVSSEFVIQANPQLVVLSDSKCCAQTAATVAARAGWSNVDAVRNGRVAPVDDDVASRWGPRILEFAKAVAAAARK
jgi:iron complex transport system substrate-binding protein